MVSRCFTDPSARGRVNGREGGREDRAVTRRDIHGGIDGICDVAALDTLQFRKRKTSLVIFP